MNLFVRTFLSIFLAFIVLVLGESQLPTAKAAGQWDPYCSCYHEFTVRGDPEATKRLNDYFNNPGSYSIGQPTTDKQYVEWWYKQAKQALQQKKQAVNYEYSQALKYYGNNNAQIKQYFQIQTKALASSEYAIDKVYSDLTHGLYGFSNQIISRKINEYMNLYESGKANQPTNNGTSNRSSAPKTTIIAVPKAIVYSSPAQDDYYNHGYMEYGAEIYDEGNVTGWMTLTLTDGSTGYISKNLVTQYTPITAKQITIRTEKALMFNIPSTGGTIRGTFTKNAKHTVIGESGSWWFVSTKDNKGNPLKGFMSKSVAW